MHLFSAIPDIEPDRQARVRTTAVAVGHRASLWIVGTLWSIAALATLWIPDLLASRFIAWLYPLLCLLLLRRSPEHTAQAYRWMPAMNILAGAILFWDIILP